MNSRMMRSAVMCGAWAAAGMLRQQQQQLAVKAWHGRAGQGNTAGVEAGWCVGSAGSSNALRRRVVRLHCKVTWVCAHAWRFVWQVWWAVRSRIWVGGCFDAWVSTCACMLVCLFCMWHAQSSECGAG